MSRRLVIVGAGQGGLSAAVHARLRGWDVTVLELREVVGGKAARIDECGFRLDPGPSIIILPRIYRSVFEAAGRHPDDYLRFERLPVLSRVYLEGRDGFMDIPADREACLAWIQDTVPEDVEGVRRLLGKLDRIAPLIDRTVFAHPIDRPWQLADPRLARVALEFDVRRTYRELVDQFVKSPLMKAFFYGFPSYSGQTYDSKAAGALLIPYYMIQEGVWWPVGGVSAIPEAFARLATELGVEIRTGVRVVGLETGGGSVTAVRTDAGETISADAFISNRDRLSVEEWKGRKATVAPSYSYFTLHWGLRSRIRGSDHHTLLVPADFERGFERVYRERSNPDRPIVYLNDTTVTDRTTAPEGGTNLFAVVTVPAMEDHLDWRSEAPRMRDAVRREMARVGIDFAPEDVVFERMQTPLTFAERDGSYRGSLYGPVESERLWGLMPLANRDPDYRNLFYVGGSVQPGAGLPMVTLSGKFAASMLPRA